MRAMSRCRGRVFRLITIQSRFLAKATHPHPHPHPATVQRRLTSGGTWLVAMWFLQRRFRAILRT